MSDISIIKKKTTDCGTHSLAARPGVFATADRRKTTTRHHMHKRTRTHMHEANKENTQQRTKTRARTHARRRKRTNIFRSMQDIPHHSKFGYRGMNMFELNIRAPPTRDEQTRNKMRERNRDNQL